VSALFTDLSPIPSVDLSVCDVPGKYCGKTADWIRMPFEVMSGVGRGMGVLDGVTIVEGEGAVLGVNVGRPIVTDWDGDALFPNYFMDMTCYVRLCCDNCRCSTETGFVVPSTSPGPV